MPRKCGICQHPACAEIDKALIADVSLRDIARQYGVAKDAVARHKVEHLPMAMVKAHEVEDVRNAIDIVQQLKAVNTACWQVLHDARSARDGELVLKATDRVLKQLELQAKLIGMLDQEGTTYVHVNTWIPVLLAALAPYPEARAAAAQAILELDDEIA